MNCFVILNIKEQQSTPSEYIGVIDEINSFYRFRWHIVVERSHS